VAEGFTYETNNLSFGPTAPSASAPGPAVVATESGATANCTTACTMSGAIRMNHRQKTCVIIGWIAIITGVLNSGCTPPEITAVNLDPHSGETQEGIPYYLPKPYLVITRNIRYIPTPTVGLTQTVPIPNSFNNAGSSPAAGGGSGASGGNGQGGQGSTGSGTAGTGSTGTGSSGTGASHIGSATGRSTGTETAAADSGTAASPGSASSNATSQPANAAAISTSSSYGNQVIGPVSIAVVPPASISDGLVPQEFYTYQILYLPDLTQKYGLIIKGGSGEMRATENLVYGWMHTGPGPLYMADSTTAQNVIAAGQFTSDVVQSLGQIALSAAGIPVFPGGGGATGKTGSATETAAPNHTVQTNTIKDYAQIYVFEPELVADAQGHKTEVWHLMKGLPKFERDWIELERQAAAAPSGNGGGSPAGMQDEDTNAETAIRQALKATWTIGDHDLTVTTTGGIMRIGIAGKSVNPGGTYNQLQTAAFDAAKAYINSAGLTIAQDPEHIIVKASIDPSL